MERVIPIGLWRSVLLFVLASFLLFGCLLDLSAFSDDHVALWRTGPAHQTWRGGFFRPLSDLSFMLGDRWFGTSVVGHRAFNLVVHGINAALVRCFYVVLVERDGKALPWASWLTGVLFLLYPFHMEGVVWLVGREASMASGFVMAALIVDLHKQAALWSDLLKGGLWLCGLLSHESAIIFPLLVFVVRVFRIDRPAAFRKDIALLGLVLAVWLTLRTVFMGGSLLNAYGMASVEHSWWMYPVGYAKALLRSFVPPGAYLATSPLLTLVLLLVIVLALLWLVKGALGRGPRVWRTPSILLVSLFLVSLLFPAILGVSTRTSESDRFLYLPSMLLVCVFGHLLRSPSAWAVKWSLVLILFATATHVGLEPWRIASRWTERALVQIQGRSGSGGAWSVVGLPGDVHGAYVFRHGFPEALLLAGGDTTGLTVGPSFDGTEVLTHPLDALDLRCRGPYVSGNRDVHVFTLEVDPKFTRK